MKCTEAEEEEVTKGKENQLQLSCFINQEVKYLFTGLKLVSRYSFLFNWNSKRPVFCSDVSFFFHLCLTWNSHLLSRLY